MPFQEKKNVIWAWMSQIVNDCNFFFLVIVRFVYFLECYRNIEDILISTIMVAYVFTWIWYE